METRIMPRQRPLWPIFFLMLAIAARHSYAAPPLTVIQDVLYKADGTRFDGVAQIEWKTFQAADGSEIPQHVLNVRVLGGNLRVVLVPTTNALRTVTYTVRFNSEGRTQFTEYWAVPASAAPLRLRDVRTTGPAAGAITAPITPAAITDVAGLRTELDLRPARLAGYINQRAAIIGASGAIEGALGNAADCVKVNGTSGPCGSGSMVFVDGELPGGGVNGTNRIFQLSGVPSPPSSLRLFQNGALLYFGSEFTLSGSTVTFAAGRAPATSDLLQAWYRLANGVTPGVNYVDGESLLGTLNGTNADFSLQAIPIPASSLQVFRNGLLQKIGVDYNVSLNSITFTSVSIPQTGDILQASYRIL
ncbi:MAG: hypothetical protein WKF37_01480 [Bryobacteraceae bacterium]